MDLYILGFNSIEKQLLKATLQDTFANIFLKTGKNISNDSFILTNNTKNIPQLATKYLVLTKTDLPIQPTILKQKINTILNSANSFIGKKFQILNNEFIANNSKVELTDKEQELLLFLLNHPNNSADFAILLKKIWGYSKDVQTNTLKTHIYNLRQKLDTLGFSNIIETNESGYFLNI